MDLIPKHSVMHAFCVKPDITFENQAEAEEVLLTLRAHPITLLPPLFNSVLIVILILFGSVFLSQFLNPGQLTFTILFSIFAAVTYVWLHIMNWYFNIGIVTNKQVVDVDFNVLTFRDVTRTELFHIEDITVKVSGFISSIIDYGNVFIQTAGSEINTEFLQVPHPAEAAHIIQDILKIYGHSD